MSVLGRESASSRDNRALEYSSIEMAIDLLSQKFGIK
jgi:hypothetical protein